MEKVLNSFGIFADFLLQKHNVNAVANILVEAKRIMNRMEQAKDA